MRVSCTVNGVDRQADDVWPGESLLYVLRERLGLPGTKNACEQGECGSCTVYLDGTAVCACLVAAGQAQGRSVVTVEGLTDPVAAAVRAGFLAAGAVQCGFCTPGLVVAVHDLLRRVPRPSDPEIREALAGNLCRCTGYESILAAVRRAAAAPGPGPAGPAPDPAGPAPDPAGPAPDPAGPAPDPAGPGGGPGGAP
jgi:aerobic carbon-monoxide dehydrogenase small subunit